MMESEKILFEQPLNSFDWVPDFSDKSVYISGPRKIEMSRFESAYLCGLLRKYKPKKILEIGVAAGGTTALILRTLQLLKLDTELYSVDLNNFYYADASLDCGYIAKELFKNANWKLLTGNIITKYLPEIGFDIDFCILDTVHRLPGEVFDFLCALPYLTNGSIVVLHDVNLHNIINKHKDSYATRLLLTVASGEKIEVHDPNAQEGIANIGAFKITEVTRNEIKRVFEILLMRWGYLPDTTQLMDYYHFICQHYPEELTSILKNAINLNFTNFNKVSPLKENFVDYPQPEGELAKPYLRKIDKLITKILPWRD